MAKKPPKEKFVLKERIKIENYVFDEPTLKRLFKLMRIGIIDSIDSIVSTGKEAAVFYGKVKGEDIAIKIYKTKATKFKNKEVYLLGDPRFSSIKKSKIIEAFVKKEFKNLQICYKNGINVPRPIYYLGNIIVMEFIGEEGIAAKKLKEIPNKKYYKEIIEMIEKMKKIGIVHADLSEYNILIHNDKPYIIDFSESVSIKHPNAKEFYERDKKNIGKFFSSL